MNLKKALSSLALGALLATGLLAARPAAADVVWQCGAPNSGLYVCPDPVLVNGVRYRNVGFWCNQSGPGAGGVCYYAQG